MTIIPHLSAPPLAPAETLRNLATALDGLTHARVSPPDIYRALYTAAPTAAERGEALRALTAGLDRTAGYEKWLDRWTGPRPRAEVVGLVRAAAEQAMTDGPAPAPWEPREGETVTRIGHDGVWIVEGYEDDDTVWLYRPGTPMVPAHGRIGSGWVDLSPGKPIPEHDELADIAEIQPAEQAEGEVSRG